MKIYAVIDAQNDFIDGVLGTAEAQVAAKRIETLLKEKLEEDDIVTFTQDTHSSNYLNTAEGKQLPVPHCIANSQGWKIPRYLIEAAGPNFDTTFAKVTFGSSEFIDYLEEVIDSYSDAPYLPEAECDVDEIIFVGFCTDICVISNVLMCQEMLRACEFDIPITVYANCCAGVTPAKHEAALEVMRSCQINVKETF